MVYDWADKESECYRLYVEEKLPLDRVMEVLKEKHGFHASKRAFQTQFKRWDFPSKQNPAHKNAALVARVKELWETNTSQKQMFKILEDEGFDIKERELMRVRAKNRWLLRVPNGTKPSNDPSTSREQSILNVDRKRDDIENLTDPDLTTGEGIIAAENPSESEKNGDISRVAKRQFSEELPPDLEEQRQQRRQKLAAQSEERWAAKKRRRRTRSWAGIPADPPGPPRFPSETTLDESKAYLHLSNDLYAQLRDKFQQICQDAEIVKKTIAGPEKWQAAKNKLVAESAHLDNEFNGIPNGVPNESKALALDVLCTDVTKRMRNMERKMTIPDAKNALGLNPEESRQIRDNFYQILKADHFTSKVEAGSEHWKELKQQWIDNSTLLQDVMNLPDDNVEKPAKLKAMDVLCRDVMKRLRDDQTRRDPSRKRQSNAGPGPGPATPVRPPLLINSSKAQTLGMPNAGMTQTMDNLRSQIVTKDTVARKKHIGIANGQRELQIDPSLLAAASDPSLAINQLQQYAVDGQNFSNPTSSLQVSQAQQSRPVPVFFRLNNSSSVQDTPTVWLDTLISTTFEELSKKALGGRSQTSLSKVEGVVVDRNSSETLFSIDRDDELAAYLAYVATLGGKPSFSVHLERQQQQQ